jgi:mRNA interferase MazF
MTSPERGDVVLVEFVFSAQTGSKKRPALILSAEACNAGRQEVVLAAITSNVARVLPGDTKLVQWRQAGLRFPSLVTGILQTVKQSMVATKLGRLTGDDLRHAETNLASAMGFRPKD